MSVDLGIRPCAFTQEWGYRTRVSVEDGEAGQPPKIVSLAFGEYRHFTLSEVGWTNMSPTEARELAEELMDAAREAEK
jgi:hypothetical protein